MEPKPKALEISVNIKLFISVKVNVTEHDIAELGRIHFSKLFFYPSSALY